MPITQHFGKCEIIEIIEKENMSGAGGKEWTDYKMRELFMVMGLFYSLVVVT